MNILKYNQKGFTLVEVMIAVGIFAIGILAIGIMQITALRSNSSARGLTEAMGVAQAKMEELKLLPFTHPDLDDNANAPDLADPENDSLNNPVKSLLRTSITPAGAFLLGPKGVMLPGGPGQPEHDNYGEPAYVCPIAYNVYWNINNILNGKEISVIITWNTPGSHDINRAQLRSVRN